jgi:ribosomal protein S18 acetylase RimI-like enzyme
LTIPKPVQHLKIPRPLNFAIRFGLMSKEDVMARRLDSGHLHINVLPSHQGQGHGRFLIEALLKALKAAACEGVHMGVVAGNAGALRFYERNGFTKFKGIAEGGELGRRGGTVIMTKKL